MFSGPENRCSIPGRVIPKTQFKLLSGVFVVFFLLCLMVFVTSWAI